MILRLKGSIYAGDNLSTNTTSIKQKDMFYLSLGIVGAIISLCGLVLQPAQIYYVLGSSLLLVTAVHFELFYFIALEIILIAGHGTILLDIGSILQLALPALLCLQLLIFYFLSGRLDTIFLIIGIIGIAFISVGFAYNNQWIFFAGSTAIGIYAYHDAQKTTYSLLWAVLNTLFASIALYRIITAWYHFELDVIFRRDSHGKNSVNNG